MPIGPHKKSTASITRCQFLRAVPLDDFFVLRSFRDSCRGVWLPRARGGGHGSELGRGLLVGAEECSSMLVSDWFTVDERRDTGGDAMRCGAMPAGIGSPSAPTGRAARLRALEPAALELEVFCLSEGEGSGRARISYSSNLTSLPTLAAGRWLR